MKQTQHCVHDAIGLSVFLAVRHYPSERIFFLGACLVKNVAAKCAPGRQWQQSTGSPALLSLMAGSSQEECQILHCLLDCSSCHLCEKCIDVWSTNWHCSFWKTWNTKHWTRSQKRNYCMILCDTNFCLILKSICGKTAGMCLSWFICFLKPQNAATFKCSRRLWWSRQRSFWKV